MNSITELLYLLYLKTGDLLNVVGASALTPLFTSLCFLVLLLGMMGIASSSLSSRSWEWWLWERVRLPALRSMSYRRGLLLLCKEVDSLDGFKSFRTERRAVERWAGTPFNWDYCTPLLLLGSPKSKRKARKNFVGREWSDFVKAVPPAERVAIYKAALCLAQVDRGILHERAKND